MPVSPGSIAIPIFRHEFGLAWLDPMCGLMLAFIVAAGLWHRRRAGGVARIDFSMIEAMLWTIAEPLLATQLAAPPQPRGNDSDDHVPHSVYRCAGEDEWVSLATATDAEWRNLCALVPGLAPMAELGFDDRRQLHETIDQALGAWLRRKPAAAAEAELRRAGIPAAALANSRDLVNSNHLKARGFWEPHGAGALPGLPWQASFGRISGAAPELGADTQTILRQVLDLSPDEIAALHRSGALG